MIRSMTGFGEAERDLPDARPPMQVRAQVKSVNHRFLQLSVRLPSGLDRMESGISELLRSRLQRGHIHFTVSVDRIQEGSDVALPELDLERARVYAEGLEQARGELGLAGQVSVSDLVRYSDLFRVPSTERGLADALDDSLVSELAEEALAGLLDMRESEGTRLATDLNERLAAITELVGVVEVRAPERLLSERDRLRAQIAELSGAPDVDEDRLAREVAYLAEKWDINEEVVRLRSHVKLFRDTLAAPVEEAVGKRLGFVLQEMNREANTITSKANDTEIARAGVGLKEEVERLREQVENIE